MTPRPRKRNNKGLPENLYTSKVNGKVYFRYRHPITGKVSGIGCNKNDAVNAAKRLNSLLIPQNDIVSDILNDETVAQHIKWFKREILAKKDYSDSQVEIYDIRLKQLETNLGDRAIESISVSDISNEMDLLTPRPAQQFRTVAIDLFRKAEGRGLIESNPAEKTNTPLYTKARQRMTEKQFYAVFEIAPLWLKNAMLLGLVTLQRRGDITRMRFDNIEGDFLKVVQEKTKKYDTAYLKIKIGPKLDEIIRNCRDDVVSPYLVHRKPIKKIKRKGCDHWTQITPEMVTRAFKDLSDPLDEFKSISPKERPTFHEIRALGIKLYKDSNIDPQKLAGHASAKMTDNYDSNHEDIRWVETEAR